MFINYLLSSVVLLAATVLLSYAVKLGKPMRVKYAFLTTGVLVGLWSLLAFWLGYLNQSEIVPRHLHDLVGFFKTLVGGIGAGMILCLWILGNLFPRPK